MKTKRDGEQKEERLEKSERWENRKGKVSEGKVSGKMKCEERREKRE